MKNWWHSTILKLAGRATYHVRLSFYGTLCIGMHTVYYLLIMTTRIRTACPTEKEVRFYLLGVVKSVDGHINIPDARKRLYHCCACAWGVRFPVHVMRTFNDRISSSSAANLFGGSIGSMLYSGYQLSPYIYEHVYLSWSVKRILLCSDVSSN